MNPNRFRNALAGALLSLALFSPAAEAARIVVKLGPPAARVDRVDVSEGLAHEPLQGFVQRETV